MHSMHDGVPSQSCSLSPEFCRVLPTRAARGLARGSRPGRFPWGRAGAGPGVGGEGAAGLCGVRDGPALDD